ncbi:MAG TPA: hypothetical protein VGS62_08280 [Streptosporangiaceae bacterium]|nr:hypothetical protein [Streptosporangiaceae bacterium]
MSSIEDIVLQVMVSHDEEAPAAADLLRALRATPGPPRRRGTWRPRAGWYLPLAAAAAVAGVAMGSVWAGGLLGGAGQAPRRTAAASPSCPARYAGRAPWVPDRPIGVDGRARLVPPATPSSVLVCAYAGSNLARQQAGWALSGRRRLTGGLAALAAQLTWQPRGTVDACTLVGGKQTNYLIGLSYPGGGRLWVAATNDPNHCVTASNGEFSSFGLIGPTVTKAFALGLWPARRPATCTGPGQGTGRFGQDAAMVPPGSISLTICPQGARILTSGYQALTSALNALPTRPSTHSCSGGPGHGPSYQLLFSYPQGPPVEVDIAANCHPAIDNYSLQSSTAHTIVPIIQHLLTTG